MQTYTTRTDDDNPRQKPEAFKAVRPGDLVIGYEANPIKQVQALLEITEAATIDPTDGRERIAFRILEQFPQQPTWAELKADSALTDCSVLINNQGSLFLMDEADFTRVVALAGGTVPGAIVPAPPPAPYTAATARREGVFASEEDIAEMVEALVLKQNIIVKGPPGVGKTFVARKVAYVLLGEKDKTRVELVQFHQSVSYEDFVRGWRPGGAGGALTIADGPLLLFAEKARKDGRPHVLIIDEINRGNLSKIFGELFMLLEADKRQPDYGVRLTYPNPERPDEKFFLPPNLYLIGTMNTADRSLALVDYALRRRFRFFDLRPQLNGQLVAFLTKHHQADAAALAPRLALINELNDLISNLKEEPLLGPGFAVGHSYFCPARQGEAISDVADWFGKIVRHELLPLLEEYWDGDPKGPAKCQTWTKKLLAATPVPALEPAAPAVPIAVPAT